MVSTVYYALDLIECRQGEEESERVSTDSFVHDVHCSLPCDNLGISVLPAKTLVPAGSCLRRRLLKP